MSIRTYTLSFTDKEHERFVNVYKDLVVSGTFQAFLTNSLLERLEDLERILGNVPEYYEEIEKKQTKQDTINAVSTQTRGEIAKKLYSEKRSICKDPYTYAHEELGTGDNNGSCNTRQGFS